MPEKTFEEIEKELFAMEDQLLKDMEGPEFKDSAISPVEEIAKDIAADWVRYSKMPRQEGVSPGYKVAIKHVAVLLGNHGYFEKQLKYGREEAQRESPEKGTVKVPFIKLGLGRVFSVSGIDGLFNTYLVTGKPDVVAEVQFNARKIQSCGECPERGKCDLVQICRSYNEREYNTETRRAINVLEPTPADFLVFEKYARGVKKTK
jgi:hypothetical protein